MIEYIYFWLAKYAVGFILLLSFVLFLLTLIGMWLLYRYCIYNYSYEARCLQRDIINTVRGANNGISYERLALAHGYSGHSIFDSVSIVDKPNKLRIFMYQYAKARRKNILVYQDGIIIHKDRLQGIKLNG